MIIFCGHFPDGTQEFTEEETENETRGQWYFRQLLGSANLTGGKLFHIMSGNLSHQIEHHLFPDIPAHRYAEISVEVREICERYGIPYNTGPLPKQFGSVVRKIVRLALPDRIRGRKDESAIAAEPDEPGARGSRLTARSWDDLNVPLSKAETRKDDVQVVVESGATHAGRIAGIVSGAVRDVTRELGEFTTELFEMRDASRRAERDREVAEQQAGPAGRRRNFPDRSARGWRRPARRYAGVECPGGCDPL